VLHREQAGDVSVYVSGQQRDETDAKAMVIAAGGSTATMVGSSI